MKKPAVWLAVGATIPIFLIVAWMILDSACGELNDLARLNACRYGWIGALSGWAAATGALTAAIWAYKGLRDQMTLQALQHRTIVLENKMRLATQQWQGISKAIKSFDYLAARAEEANLEDKQSSFIDFVRDIEAEEIITRLKESVAQVRSEHSATAKLALGTAESLLASAGQLRRDDFRTQCIGFKTLRHVLTVHAQGLHKERVDLETDLKKINERISGYEQL